MSNAETHGAAVQAAAYSATNLPHFNDQIKPEEAVSQNYGSETRETFKTASTDHWLPDCLCAHLHEDCPASRSPSPNSEQLAPPSSPIFHVRSVTMTLAELQSASQSSCWLYSVIFTGIKNMPTWDPTKPAPNRASFRLETSKTGVNIEALGGTQRRVPEPGFFFYVDGQKGK
ncbi:hypothetical protein FVEN_g936 [Fusarium venenatum]|uniref:Uncharacterized protein n=1 Tax=Fusarium venenatum TaxID=56646 RepID=A0A2L2THX8_9HYPO|nr:uncharacterized protein FVRRES_10651 [Fusarium venenatum]KAG8361392.1 hypothetical protein FVEN_g936 [Fusarium venenatum]KAH6967241.1 hypothetical protein EDB82DRAFT_518190 [Fusarium venenatum]CEI70574.1 unnamed protein product [Fusarium venenatum]